MSDNSDPLEAFGRRVRELRLERGVSQEDFAKIVGLDRTYISSLERGKRNVSLRNIHRLAEALGVAMRDLLQGPN